MAIGGSSRREIAAQRMKIAPLLSHRSNRTEWPANPTIQLCPFTFLGLWLDQVSIAAFRFMASEGQRKVINPGGRRFQIALLWSSSPLLAVLFEGIFGHRSAFRMMGIAEQWKIE